MGKNLLVNGNFWNGINGFTPDGIVYELKRVDNFFDYCEFKSNGSGNARFYTYFNDVVGSGFVAGNAYRIGFWAKADLPIDLYVGCNEQALSFRLTADWRWYESSYSPSITQAVSIKNLSTTTVACISGIWIQDGNDPITPDVSPFIDIVKLTNGQINLDSMQIEQGSIISGAVDELYSKVKVEGGGYLFFERLRSRNLFEIPSANREIEISGNLNGFEWSVLEFDRGQKLIRWNGWYTESQCSVGDDARYITLLLRKNDNSLIEPDQFIARGGVLHMSNYSTLPILTDTKGLEYAEGFNLFQNGAITAGNMGQWMASSGLQFTITDNPDIGAYWTVRVTPDVTVNDVGLCFLGGTAGYSNKAILDPGITYTWSFDCLCDYATSFNSARIGHIQCRDVKDVSKVHMETGMKYTPSTIPAKTWTHCRVEFQVTTQSYFIPYLWYLGAIDGMKNNGAVHFQNFMLQVGTKKYPYRPNPVDLIGGGLPMSIVARGSTITVRNSIDEAIQNSAAQLEQRLSTAITQTGEAIEHKVVQEYYAKGDTDRLITEASTILSQKYNSFEMSFNSFKQIVNNNQNMTNAEFATITKFIRFIDGNIFLGEEGNNQTLKIAKDRISFLQGNSEVAYISDSALYIYDGVFLNSLRVGNFAFAPRANGSLDFKKVR